MVVCKYFLAGNCRFGSNCRFEHAYSSKYSYHAPQNQNSAPGPQQTSVTVTDEQLVNQVRADVQAALRGGQWVLSSYAPFKEKPALPGITDLSPEEARLFIYEAKASNNVEQAVAYMNNLLQEARQKYEQLLQPTPAITNILRKLYNGEIVSSPFNNIQRSGFGTNNSGASSVFRSAVQNTASVFGQNQNNSSVFSQVNQNNTASIFGQNNQSNAASVYAQGNQASAASIFAQKASSVFATSTDNAQSVFAQANQNVFASPTSPFGAQSPDVAKSIFAQANQSVQPNNNIFQSPPQQANPSNVFASGSQQFFGPSPFAQQSQKQEPTNAFGGANAFQTKPEFDEGIYTPESELTSNDLKAFKSKKFELGFIPEVPPPTSLINV